MMPIFLWYYLAGLGLALGVGIVLYYVIGGHIVPLLSSLFGEHAGQVWGRSFRLTLIACALLGGFTVTWHGCHGYGDYAQVADDRNLMFQKLTEQVSGAMQYSVYFLVLAATVGALMYSVLIRRKSTTQSRDSPHQRS